MHVYRIPYSTNVERVAFAAGHKGLTIDWIDVPAEDRSEVVAISGQPLVPVLVEGDVIVQDSPAILLWLEERFPEPALYPFDPARRAEVETFVDWFNLVWKAPPNLIAEELSRPAPDQGRLAAFGGEMTAALARFEELLTARPFLFGDTLGVADVTSFPFVKYRTRWEEGDDELFHLVLRDHQSGGDFPGVDAWIDRVDLLPRA